MQKITLSKPLVMGEKTIDTLEVREPNAGDCRGINLMDLFNKLDTGAYMQLLPRITTPSLTAAQVASLSLMDMAKFVEAVSKTFNQEAEDTPKAIGESPTT
ncbi:phage tail assembly protein [Histophilus somni]|uniref:phage tail assembly protein n=1 Tax=Histophilus somni TaxID=731 RepID=UPI00201EA2E8|nr:phage tail assembly protein [Histophilus somni]